MTTPITFTVPAVPIAQPRPRAVVAHGGKGARMHEVTSIKNPITGERKPHPIAAFKASVRHEARAAYDGPPLQGPLSVELVFVMPRPSSLFWKTRPMPRQWHTVKPDADNLIKSVLDALKGLCWRDDAQVARMVIAKQIANGEEQPSVSVSIEALEMPRVEEVVGALFGE